MEYFSPSNLLTPLQIQGHPKAQARIQGNQNHPTLYGLVAFAETASGGVIVSAEIHGLPANASGFYGMHIHEKGDCTPPFDQTGGHYNPTSTSHPMHAGDLLPLLSNQGSAWMCFFTDRFTVPDILGKSLVIHDMRDDFTSQPAGDSGTKIGCGVIYASLASR